MDQDPDGSVIFAKASGPGPAAISLVRLSGSGSIDLIAKLLRADPPPPRRASLRKLTDPVSGELIDEALVTCFADGGSFTGEEAVELGIHGGLAVTERVYQALESAGARIAAPGEFSRRALRNGRLDLSQAEAIGALIAAEHDQARRHALRVLSGEVERLALEWRVALTETLGLLETGVDFVEEELGADLEIDARDRVTALAAELRAHAADQTRFDKLTETPVIGLFGPPNAGKSSLMNAVLGEDRAIVSEAPGTTRDRIDAALTHRGRRYILSDTAGFRSAADPVEEIGVEKARRALEQADLRIFVVSADTIADFEAERFQIEVRDAIFWTKIDARPRSHWPSKATEWRFEVSSFSPVGVRSAIEAFLEGVASVDDAPCSPISGSERRVALVLRAADRLDVMAGLIAQGSVETAIEEGRAAVNSLFDLVGSIGNDDVLDTVFSRFCVGKCRGVGSVSRETFGRPV
ncbi:MAG: tRNA modification GTPase [Pseudomonadota bacterium]